MAEGLRFKRDLIVLLQHAQPYDSHCSFGFFMSMVGAGAVWASPLFIMPSILLLKLASSIMTVRRCRSVVLCVCA